MSYILCSGGPFVWCWRDTEVHADHSSEWFYYVVLPYGQGRWEWMQTH